MFADPATQQPGAPPRPGFSFSPNIGLPMKIIRRIIALLLATGLSSCQAAETSQPQSSLDWRGRLPTAPAALATPEAIAIADNLLAYQYKSGGWPKNIAMEKPLTDADRAALAARDEQKPKSENAPTIDNG